MAEVFKEFVNKNITVADVAADNQSITLFTNQSNKQAIVRDITINSGQKIGATTAKLFIGNQIVLDSFKNATGSLLVDAGQSLVLKLNSALTAGSTTQIPLTYQRHKSGSTSMTYREYTWTVTSGLNTDYSQSGGLAVGTDYSGTTETDAWANGMLGSSYYGPIYRNSNGKWWGFYKDNNSTSSVRYSHSGNSTWTQAQNKSYGGPAIDWELERLYQKDDSTLDYWDMTETNSSSQGGGSIISTQTTYQIGAAVNAGGVGYYYTNYNGSGHAGWIKEVGSTHYSYLSGSNWGNQIQSRANAVLAYNSDEERLYLFMIKGDDLEDSNSLYFATIPLDQVANAGSANLQRSEGTHWYSRVTGGRFSDTFGIAPAGNARNLDYASIGGKYLSYPISTTQHRIVECKNNGVSEVAVLDVPFENDEVNNGVSYSALYGGGPHIVTTTNIADYVLDTQVRITGVEIS